MTSQAPAKEVSIEITAKDPRLLDVLKELSGASHLIFALARRQISVRYAQTIFGALWVLIQPIFTALLYTLVFGMFVKVPTAGVPYPLFALSGMIAWGLFTQAMERASISIIQDERMITKVYFPRLALPVAAAGSTLVDFGVSLLVLLPVGWYFGYGTGPMLLVGILGLIPLFLCALSAGVLLASLNIRWRDLRQVAPFLTQILVWASPVAWPLELAPKEWQSVLLWNPLTPPILLFRACITGGAMPPMWSLVASLVTSLLVAMLAFQVFRRVERNFADYI